MGALVTLPLQIDLLNDPPSSQWSRQDFRQTNPWGIFLGPSGYYLYCQANIQCSPDYINVQKSLDNGATWAQQDKAHQPTVTASSDPKACAFDATGSILYIFYSVDGTNYFIITFNTNTDLWGSAGVTVTETGLSTSNAPIYRQSGGTIVVFYGDLADHLELMTFAAGAWTAPVTVDTLAAVVQPQFAMVDSSDRGHVLYSRHQTPTTLWYVQISALLAAGTPISLTTQFDFTRPDGLIWNSNLVFAWTENQAVKVAIGTPLGAPVFTVYTTSTVAGSGNVSYATLGIDGSGKLTVFWVHTDYGVTPVVDRYWMQVFDGIATWGAPVLFYDEVANPPANAVELHGSPASSQFLHLGQARYIAGRWVLATALETFDVELPCAPAGIEHCTGFVLIPGVRPVITRSAFPQFIKGGIARVAG